jgi:flagellar export protein FliJ
VKTFRFSLQRVLEWRTVQLRAEEEKLAALMQRLDKIIQNINGLTAAEQKSEEGVLSRPEMQGGELQALAAFRARIQKHRSFLESEKQACEKQVAAQRAQMLKARKELLVLEKLKDKRHKAWVYLSNRELEELAADSFISKLVRSEGEA